MNRAKIYFILWLDRDRSILHVKVKKIAYKCIIALKMRSKVCPRLPENRFVCLNLQLTAKRTMLGLFQHPSSIYFTNSVVGNLEWRVKTWQARQRKMNSRILMRNQEFRMPLKVTQRGARNVLCSLSPFIGFFFFLSCGGGGPGSIRLGRVMSPRPRESWLLIVLHPDDPLNWPWNYFLSLIYTMTLSQFCAFWVTAILEF